MKALMKTTTPTFPTAYEVAQLAIALRGSEAGASPAATVEVAMGLWLAASREIEAAEKRGPIVNRMHYAPEAQQEAITKEIMRELEEKRRAENPTPDDELLRLFPFPGQDTSPALDWWRLNMPDDIFHGPAWFKKAWLEYTPKSRRALHKISEENCYITVPVRSLKAFAEWRKARVRAADKRRKSVGAEQKTANPEKKGGKISHGKKVKPPGKSSKPPGKKAKVAIASRKKGGTSRKK